MDITPFLPFKQTKAGDPNSLSNYRDITLIAVISKLFDGILLEVCHRC